MYWVNKLYHLRAKLLNADWLRQRAIFLIRAFLVIKRSNYYIFCKSVQTNFIMVDVIQMKQIFFLARTFQRLDWNLTQKKKKLIMFQYKIIHHILFTNTLLYKLQKVASPNCPFAQHHIKLWSIFLSNNAIQNWSFQSYNIEMCLSSPDIIYGVISQLTLPCLALNHLIILGTYFLYVNALNDKKSFL